MVVMAQPAGTAAPSSSSSTSEEQVRVAITPPKDEMISFPLPLHLAYTACTQSGENLASEKVASAAVYRKVKWGACNYGSLFVP